jgi:hypothetical protein
MITMSDPDVYTTIEKEFKILDSLIKPKHYFMNHDEIRMMNWDYGDQSRGLTPGQILADNTNKCFDIIRKYNPDAQIWDWSDMFDEHHNAKPKDYYLVNGDLTGSADLINKEIGIAKWDTTRHQQSLDFFSSKGFKLITAPYYDQDENNIRMWKEWTQNTPDFYGMIYTTWQRKYTHLVPFAEYSWNHAPYIYHYPLKNLPDSVLTLNATFSGDDWDKGWQLSEAALYYRTNPGDTFTKIDMAAKTDEPVNVTITLPENNKFLQYYFEAKDNHSWITKVPFGKDKYFEIGQVPISVDDRYIKEKIKIHPNPASDFIEINVGADSRG